MKFIMVTGMDGADLIIRSDLIIGVSNEKNKQTEIVLHHTSDATLEVKETVEEVFRRLKHDYA